MLIVFRKKKSLQMYSSSLNFESIFSQVKMRPSLMSWFCMVLFEIHLLVQCVRMTTFKKKKIDMALVLMYCAFDTM